MNSEQLPRRIRHADPGDLAEILALISEVGLPVAGVREHLQHFLVLETDGSLEGTVGLELYGRHALLRSLAVSPRQQGRGEGRKLCETILERARSLGVEEVVLLTETAAGFFRKLGFRTVPRDEVSEAVRASVELTSICPVSAICMQMYLHAAPPSRGESLA